MGRTKQKCKKTGITVKRFLCTITLLAFVSTATFSEIREQKEEGVQATQPNKGYDTDRSSTKYHRPARLSIGTNLLYLAALAPNVSAEYYFPKNEWSLLATFTMPWWKRESKHQFYQIRQYLVEGRYWFPNASFSKGQHFGGFNIHGGIYDLENKKTGYYGEFLGASLTYGYRLRLNEKMALEFTVAGGYIFTNYDKYTPMDNCYVYLSSNKTHYWGVTKAGVSLVWNIFYQKR